MEPITATVKVVIIARVEEEAMDVALQELRTLEITIHPEVLLVIAMVTIHQIIMVQVKLLVSFI